MSSPDTPAPPKTPHALRLQGHIERLVERARPWSWLWPPLAFLAGLGSFFLVDRQQWLGVVLALGMLLAWVLLLSESLIGRLLLRRGHPSLPRGVTTFITQMVHQETLFFCLPFVLATTVWSSGQALFALLILAMALLSVLDPLYYRLADRARWLYFAFHAQCVFLVVLVTLPIMFQLTTGASLKLALGAMLAFSLPSLWQLLRPMTPGRWGTLLLVLPLLASLAWVGRVWVPPANLWLSASALSPDFDEAARSPRGSARLTPETLTAQGLYAFTAIRAPRGLREEIVHEWYHENERIDRIELTIHGGRQEGYRAWTHKLNFPEKPAGRWRVDVMTDSGQRIGMLRFRVAEQAAQATLADGQAMLPPGLPGLDLRRLVPGNRPGQVVSDEPAPDASQAEPGPRAAAERNNDTAAPAEANGGSE
ncbi:DUF2914 domain-containing protein [Halomonas campisalis]|uniref:DUF2914 domain-containing protein n=1 Tax=Billgrantia campisalis TaxID=74661 RepID=A0ABS9PBR9_9GAMM|nr:DUF5924 family protein [Halomonas campisalis]MCG6659203.1 DUF2914 domain-containing protein [Halomonas campisalis]MDR5864961.1 DUF5924 family protein [Halomonas campisalis]